MSNSCYCGFQMASCCGDGGFSHHFFNHLYFCAHLSSEEQGRQEEANNDSAQNSQQKSHPPLLLSPTRSGFGVIPFSSLLSPLSPTLPLLPAFLGLHACVSKPLPLPRRSQKHPLRFAESDDGLEFICVYNWSRKPANISRPCGEETEVEIEAEPSSHPFPHSPGPSPLPP